MKYLNNILTGQVIKLNKVSDTGIYYSIFENKIFSDSGKFGIDKRIDCNLNEIELTSGGLFSELKQEAALIQLSSIEKDFVLNDDPQNWYIKKGSTGLNTVIRLTIPNQAYDSALKDKDNLAGQFNPLWQVINFGTENINAQFSQVTYNAIVIYLEELLPEHRQVIEMYTDFGVKIEGKL